MFGLPAAALPDEGPLELQLHFFLRSGRLRGALAYKGSLFSLLLARAASVQRMSNGNSEEQSTAFGSPAAALSDECSMDLELRFLLRSGRLQGAHAYKRALLLRRWSWRRRLPWRPRGLP